MNPPLRQVVFPFLRQRRPPFSHTMVRAFSEKRNISAHHQQCRPTFDKVLELLAGRCRDSVRYPANLNSSNNIVDRLLNSGMTRLSYQIHGAGQITWAYKDGVDAWSEGDGFHLLRRFGSFDLSDEQDLLICLL